MPSILVTDDGHATRAAIELVLTKHKLGVPLASDGTIGLRLVQSNPFDVVIVDMFMPAMDGARRTQPYGRPLFGGRARRGGRGIAEARLVGPQQPDIRPQRRHHDPHQVGSVLRRQLLHDAVPMDLHRPRTDAEMAGLFLVGMAAGDLEQDVALPRRQTRAEVAQTPAARASSPPPPCNSTSTRMQQASPALTAAANEAGSD